MTSAKTALQEVAVHSGKALPIYTSSYEGPDHDRRYVATCAFDGLVLASSPQKTKRSAESDAAHNILQELETVSCQSTDVEMKSSVDREPPESLENLSSNVRICIVDLDNFDIPPQFLQQLNVRFLLFRSKTCTKPDGNYKSSPNCMIFVTPCVGRDATDIYMTYESHGIASTFPEADIAVVTRDHFGATLAHIMRATYVCNDTDLVEWLARGTAS